MTGESLLRTTLPGVVAVASLAAVAAAAVASVPGLAGWYAGTMLVAPVVVVTVVGRAWGTDEDGYGHRGFNTVVLFGPVLVPIHALYLLDPYSGTLLDLADPSLGAVVALYPLGMAVAALVATGQLVVLGLVDSALSVGLPDPSDATDGLSVGRPTASGAFDRLADTRLWESETVTQEAVVDCDRCGWTDVEGVRRTTVGGVAGRPIREETESVCDFCRGADD